MVEIVVLVTVNVINRWREHRGRVRASHRELWVSPAWLRKHVG
jgi:hypothetical protein